MPRQTRCRNVARAIPLSWSPRLAQAAYLHSLDMVRNGFLSHTGSDGSSAGRRISRQKYPWRAYGDNPAARYWTLDLAAR